MNLPIYRAKKIDSNEYVEGFYIEDYGIASYIQESKYLNFIVSDRGEKGMEVDTLFQIDPTTLSISFPDMLDSQGNRIFASLSEDGKGGDIVEYNGRQEIIKYSNGTIQTYMFRFEDLKELNFKAIGIKE